jgi:hypothetical protein
LLGVRFEGMFGDSQTNWIKISREDEPLCNKKIRSRISLILCLHKEKKHVLFQQNKKKF